MISFILVSKLSVLVLIINIKLKLKKQQVLNPESVSQLYLLWVLRKFGLCARRSTHRFEKDSCSCIRLWTEMARGDYSEGKEFGPCSNYQLLLGKRDCLISLHMIANFDAFPELYEETFSIIPCGSVNKLTQNASTQCCWVDQMTARLSQKK